MKKENYNSEKNATIEKKEKKLTQLIVLISIIIGVLFTLILLGVIDFFK